MMLPLLLGGGALAIWYFYFRNPAAAAPVTVAPGTPSSLLPAGPPTTLPGSIPAQTGISSTATGQPIVNQNNSTIAITSWANSGVLSPANRNQLFSQLPNMSVDETNELADIIVNVWGKGIAPTTAQSLWWNNWRVKYHVDDGTYT